MYIEYYNLLNSGNTATTYLLGFIFLIVVGNLSYIFREKVVRKIFKILPYFSLIASIIFIVIFVTKNNEYNKYKKVILNKQHSVIEGVVSKLTPMEPGVREYEEIEIEGLTFRYSDYQNSIGFKNSAYMNGPLYEGANVRMFYYEGTILGLWIKE